MDRKIYEVVHVAALNGFLWFATACGSLFFNINFCRKLCKNWRQAQQTCSKAQLLKIKVNIGKRVETFSKPPNWLHQTKKSRSILQQYKKLQHCIVRSALLKICSSERKKQDFYEQAKKSTQMSCAIEFNNNGNSWNNKHYTQWYEDPKKCAKIRTSFKQHGLNKGHDTIVQK